MTFTNDINDLIRLNRGDVKRLRRIRDTIKHDNFITTVDKKYVESLISTYLSNQSFDESELPKNAWDDIQSKEELKQNSKTSMSGSNSLFDLSNNKKFGIIGGIAAVIALAAVIGFSGSMDQSDTITSSNTGSISTQQLMINVDESSYKLSDIISVYGTVNSPNGKLVELSVENTSGDKIWKEYVTIKSNGKFSTLVIAGGYGWDNSGDYLLKAQHNNLENEIEFSFNAL